VRGFDVGQLLAIRAELEPIGPWTDPDQPDPVLDAAYRGGIMPPGQRIGSDFTYKPASTGGIK
jgi:hypothetical protein